MSAPAVGEQDDRSSSFERRLLVWLFAAVAATGLLFQEGAVTVYDGRTVLAVTQSVVEHGSFAVDPELVTLPGRGGHHYSRFGAGLSILAAVPYLLVRPVAVRTSHAEELLEAAAATVMAVVTAALVVALYLLARRLGSGRGGSVLVGAGSVAGTFLLPYSKEFFSEPLTALCLVVAVERLLAGRAGLAGLAAGAAAVTRPQTGLVAPVLVVVAAWTQGRRGAARTAAGLAPGVGVTLAYNVVRFGSPLEFGYAGFGFTNPIAVGVRGLLLEPTKSVLLFAPIVVVLPMALTHVWRAHRPAFALLSANLGLTVVLTVTWFAWHGGWSWGPRLLIPGLVPALAAVAAWMEGRSLRQGAVVVLLVVGLVVSFPALVVSTQAQQQEAEPIPPGTPYLPTAPLSSPTVPRQLQLLGPVTRYTIDNLYDPKDDGLNYQRYLSLWQVGLARVAGPAGLAAGVAGSVVLAGFVAVSALGVRRQLRALARGG